MTGTDGRRFSAWEREGAENSRKKTPKNPMGRRHAPAHLTHPNRQASPGVRKRPREELLKNLNKKTAKQWLTHKKKTKKTIVTTGEGEFTTTLFQKSQRPLIGKAENRQLT